MGDVHGLFDVAGRVALELFQLRPVEHPDLLLVLQLPATPEDLRRVLAITSASR